MGIQGNVRLNPRKCTFNNMVSNLLRCDTPTRVFVRIPQHTTAVHRRQSIAEKVTTGFELCKLLI